jgi:uncharacterized protein (DUF952 family)
MTAVPPVIYRLIPRESWRAAEAAGVFEGSEHDRRDGFIHFSTESQVRETAAKHYAQQANLLLLFVDVDKLAAPLRWESSRHGELFPHLYGPLPVAAVSRAAALPLDANGMHRFEGLLPAALGAGTRS